MHSLSVESRSVIADSTVSKQSLSSRLKSTSETEIPFLHAVYDDTLAYIPNLRSVSSADVRAHWSKIRPPLPAYAKAMQSIVLDHRWLAHTRVVKHIYEMKLRFRADRELEKRVLRDFEAILLRAIQSAYPASAEPRRQRDVVLDMEIFPIFTKLFELLQWRKAYFAYSLEVYCGKSTRDEMGE
jgi:hypothetical protein